METENDACETWTLVQNPESIDVQIEVSYLPSGGGSPVTFADTVPARSRKTYSMADRLGPSARASIKVLSATTGNRIVVERAM
ncbi:MAG: hypothetical protein KKF41_16010 [Actinobacteria bacterium]|nr:hypothetical protein [Actinomycetota bacterium]MBU1944531.1 hypothetical protein [Actinomycetota bacterium]MBU2689084.1 hypothetical protein [Actinomycetota bacterium]